MLTCSDGKMLLNSSLSDKLKVVADRKMRVTTVLPGN